MDTSRLSQGELIAGISGLALFVILFLPWYGVDVNVAGFSASETASAWEAFDMTDILLFLVAVVAVGAAALRLADSMPEGVPVAAIVTGAGALALLLVLFRLIELPGPDIPDVAGAGIDFGRRFGIFLGLIAAGGVAYGGYRSMSDAPQPAQPAPPPAPPPVPPDKPPASQEPGSRRGSSVAFPPPIANTRRSASASARFECLDDR